MRRLLTVLPVALACLLWAPSAEAKPDAQGRPFGQGTMVPRIGLGVGFNPSFFSLGWSAGFGYFVVDGLELGATLSGTHLIWSPDIKLEYRGIEDKLPGTLIEVTPKLRYIFYRSPAFSPYAFAGVGPTMLTNNAPAPVIGHWTAGPGVIIGLGPHVFLDLSVSFSGRFPGQTCTDAYTGVFDTNDGLVELEVGGFCGFQWSPGVGVGIRI